MFSLFETNDLEKAMDFCAMRQNVISSNIANANSPDYEAQGVFFEEEFERATGHHGRPGKMVLQSKPVVQATGGKVDIITEMAELAKNQILYDAYSSRVTANFKNLNWILENSGR